MNVSIVLVGGMIGLFLLACGFILIFLTYQRRLIARDLMQQKLLNAHQRELLHAVIDSQEAERKRIAHDLHDELGALLSTSRLYLNQLQPGISDDKVSTLNSKINSLFDEMMHDIRRLSHDLRPVILENLGLFEAIENIRHNISEGGLELNWQYQPDLTITPRAELILFRIIQELVTNTVKHAHATKIDIDMKRVGEQLVIRYGDDGVGFAPNKKSSGLGLKGIESRLSMLDATLTIERPASGVLILIQIPFQMLFDYGKH